MKKLINRELTLKHLQFGHSSFSFTANLAFGHSPSYTFRRTPTPSTIILLQARWPHFDTRCRPPHSAILACALVNAKAIALLVTLLVGAQSTNWCRPPLPELLPTHMHDPPQLRTTVNGNSWLLWQHLRLWNIHHGCWTVEPPIT